jgi:hypothetical protein
MNTVYSFIGTLFQKINDIQLSQQELAILTDDARNFIFNERYSLLLYSIMSCEVDPKKRFIFSQTISELFLIMSNNSKQTDIDIPDQKIALTNKETNIEDIEKFLANAGYSNIPMALIALNPRYSKYLKFFAKALFDSTREIVLRTAQYSDPNIVLTRAINDGLAIGSVTAWSFVNPDSRNELLYANLGAYWLFSRLNEGRSPLPDFATSTGIAVKGVPPSKIGVGYIALDTVNEVLYLAEKNKEWREHLKNSGQENKDPCETGTKFNAPTECNLETKQTLQRNMDEQEGT